MKAPHPLPRALLPLALLQLSCLPAGALAEPPAAQRAPGWEAGHIRAADGYRLPYRRWGPEPGAGDGPEAVVLALHGLNDYSKGMAYAARYLARHGIATYAYDQRGWGANEDAGLWPGIDPLLDDAAAVIDLLAERYPGTPLYLMGHSMGGAVAMVLMAERSPEPVSGVVLLAPAVWGREAMPWYQRSALRLTARLLPGLELSSEVAGTQPTDDPEIRAMMREDPLIRRTVRADTLAGVTDLMDRALAVAPGLSSRALILYGEQDEVIPPGPTCLMLRRLPEHPSERQRLALYPEGYHMLTRDLQRERVHADLAAWLLDPDGGDLPSGMGVTRSEAIQRLCPASR
ncbi:MAG: lysophospholipase [Halorhodospira sp.]